MTPHLNHHQRETLNRVFAHPIAHNLEWRDLESLLEAVGSCEWTHDDHLKVTIGDSSHVVVRPKSKDVEVDTIVDLRHFLRGAGIEPESA